MYSMGREPCNFLPTLSYTIEHSVLKGFWHTAVALDPLSAFAVRAPAAAGIV
jgi:hypothetical protein